MLPIAMSLQLFHLLHDFVTKGTLVQCMSLDVIGCGCELCTDEGALLMRTLEAIVNSTGNRTMIRVTTCLGYKK